MLLFDEALIRCFYRVGVLRKECHELLGCCGWFNIFGSLSTRQIWLSFGNLKFERSVKSFQKDSRWSSHQWHKTSALQPWDSPRGIYWMADLQISEYCSLPPVDFSVSSHLLLVLVCWISELPTVLYNLLNQLQSQDILCRSCFVRPSPQHGQAVRQPLRLQMEESFRGGAWALYAQVVQEVGESLGSPT